MWGSGPGEFQAHNRSRHSHGHMSQTIRGRRTWHSVDPRRSTPATCVCEIFFSQLVCGDTVVPTSNSSDVHSCRVRKPLFEVTMTHRCLVVTHPHGVARATGTINSSNTKPLVFTKFGRTELSALSTGEKNNKSLTRAMCQVVRDQWGECGRCTRPVCVIPQQNKFPYVRDTLSTVLASTWRETNPLVRATGLAQSR